MLLRMTAFAKYYLALLIEMTHNIQIVEDITIIVSYEHRLDRDLNTGDSERGRDEKLMKIFITKYVKE